MLRHFERVPTISLLYLSPERGSASVADADLELVANAAFAPATRRLFIGESREVTAAGWAELVRLRALEELVVNGTNASICPSIAELTSLKSLVLVTSGWSPEETARLEVPKTVERLGLSEMQFGGEKFVKLIAGHPLAELTLAGLNVSDADLETLATLPRLTILQVLNCHTVSDEGANRLAKIASLERLTLWGCSIGDAGLARLESLERLRHLELASTQVTAAGIERFRRARPDCEVVSDVTAADAQGDTE